MRSEPRAKGTNRAACGSRLRTRELKLGCGTLSKRIAVHQQDLRRYNRSGDMESGPQSAGKRRVTSEVAVHQQTSFFFFDK